MLILSRRYGTTKPVIVSPALDAGHPLVYGLGAVWLLNAGSAVCVYSVGGLLPHAETIGALTNTPTHHPRGMTFVAASSQHILYPAQVRMPLAINAGTATLAAGCRLSALITVNASIIGFGDSGAGTALFALHFSAAEQVTLRVRNDAGTNSNATGATTLTVDQDYILSASAYASDNKKVFVDGREDGSNATSTGTITPDSLSLGAMKVAGTQANFMQGQIYWAMVWTRALSPTEHLMLATRPFEMFRLPRWYAKAAPAAFLAKALMQQQAVKRAAYW